MTEGTYTFFEGVYVVTAVMVLLYVAVRVICSAYFKAKRIHQQQVIEDYRKGVM